MDQQFRIRSGAGNGVSNTHEVQIQCHSGGAQPTWQSPRFRYSPALSASMRIKGCHDTLLSGGDLAHGDCHVAALLAMTTDSNESERRLTHPALWSAAAGRRDHPASGIGFEERETIGSPLYPHRYLAPAFRGARSPHSRGAGTSFHIGGWRRGGGSGSAEASPSRVFTLAISGYGVMLMRALFAFALLGLSGALSGCGGNATAAAPKTSAISEVDVLTIRSTRTAGVTELPGAVTPIREVTLTAPIAGQVVNIAEEGARVTSSQVAATLDVPGLPEQVSATRAAVTAAEQKGAAAQTTVRQVETDAETSVQTLEQNLASARAERDRRKSMLAEARLQAGTEPAKLQAQLEASEAKVRFLQSGEREQRIKQAQAELETARAEQEQAEQELRRNRGLWARGFISQREVELSALTVKRAKAHTLMVEEEMKLQKEGAHPEAIREAQRNVDAARQQRREADTLQETVKQREAELAQSEAELAKAELALKNARENRLPITRARQEAEASQAEARRSRLELAEAQQRLSRSAVRSPISGQVVKRLARPGETVAVGAPLAQIVDPDGLMFQASVPDTLLARVRQGAPIQVLVPAVSPKPLPARVQEVILSSDPAHREYRVRIALEHPSGLRPGMAGTARLNLPSDAPGLRIPVGSLVRHFPREGRGEVLVLAGDRTSVREVKLGAVTGEQVEVTGGLLPGDRVVVMLPGGLDAGATVRAREVQP